MGPRRRKRSAPEHREPAVLVKGRGNAVPPAAGQPGARSHFKKSLVRGPATYFINNDRRHLTNGPVRQRTRSIEMITIPDDELRRWLASAVGEFPFCPANGDYRRCLADPEPTP
jgi:hypothetical protein